MVLGSVIAASALVAACSGSKPKPATGPAASAEETAAAQETAAPTATPTAAPSAAATAEPKSAGGQGKWDGLTKDQRMDVMKTVVTPKMTATFQGFDAKLFAKVTCATCHGAGAKDGKFAMPNADLPKLSTDGKFAAEMKKSPVMTKFMMEKVVPDMAGAIGEAAYDPKTKQGFGCFNCHVAAK